MEKEKKIGTTMKERCGDWVTTFECIGYVNGHNVWGEKKREYSPQPKQEWKQENTGDLTDFENAMMHIGGSFFGENAGLDPNDTNAIKEQATLLLELVSKQEWSEEDEESILEICNYLDRIVREDEDNQATQLCVQELKEWLKSLRPQNTWRPSYEQMNGLKEAIEFLDCTKTRREQLQSLYEQLKKLREE